MSRAGTHVKRPRTYTLDSGDEVVEGSVLAMKDLDVLYTPENAGLGPVTLAVALTADGEWIPVYGTDSDDGTNWTRPSEESVSRLGRDIVDDWTYADMPDIEIGCELFLRWADIVSGHMDLNGYLGDAVNELEGLAGEAWRSSRMADGTGT